MTSTHHTHHQPPHKRDFSPNTRLPLIAGLAVLAGCLATLAAFALLNLIHLFTNLFFFGKMSFAEHSPALNRLGDGIIAVPVVGSLIVGLIARYGSDKIRGHGIPEAIEAILYGRSMMSPKVAVLKPLASAIAIGSGGPFGAEGPIIMTGGALGSLLAQCVHVTSSERKTLVVAGATAGMTAVFGTPVAAVLLAVELLLFELRPRSLLPVALACAVAGFVRALCFGTAPLFPLNTAPASLDALPSCLIAGLLAGALASGLSLALYKVEDLFAKLPLHWSWWPALGGLAIGIGGWVEPRALGVGYDVIGDLLHQHILVQAALALLSIKALIWVISLASGTSGGVLAPLLMLGAGLGVILSHVLPGGEPALWPLACMAAMLGATLGAPLTAIVFAFGVTHDSNALLPLLATTLTAYGFVTIAMRRSIMTEKIARRGRHIYREYSVDPLERHYIEDVMSREVEAIDARLLVREVLERYYGRTQRFRAYPVTFDGVALGVADRALFDEARTKYGSALDEMPLSIVMDLHTASFALPQETCREVATRLAMQHAERLVVVENLEARKPIGIVTRSDLIEPARAHYDEEHRLERVF